MYRTAIEDFGFTNGFDPTGEYVTGAWDLYSNLLLRNLVTYRHIAGEAGDELVPDVAVDLPEVSADRLTYTFKLKDGVMFGPPLSRAVTSHDFEYAFERINTKSLLAQYGNYYNGVIEGMTGRAKKPEPISGIETPDDSTIIFHLVKPTGDLLNRLAMPATAPIPREVARCFTRAGDYGRYVISSGPYMLKGEDQLAISSCDTLEPISGFDPETRILIVRNPNYDPATDSREVRENNIDGVAVTIDANTEDIFNKIQAGELDGSWASVAPKAVEQQYLTNPDLKDNLHADSSDLTWYITMNLLVPPFDDVHVRKAVNYVIDKTALLKAWGGPVHGEIATSVEPPTVLPTTAAYDPYPSANHEGDISAAMNEMRQSRYDSDGDGKCDSEACNNILMVSRNIEPWADMNPTLQQDLAEIGINLKIRELDASTAYSTMKTTDNLIPIAANAGWGKDYADPYAFDFFIFDSAGIACSGSVNYANVGMTKARATECGPKVLAAWNAATNNGAIPLPSVDRQVNTCYGLTGDDRAACWTNLDHYLMETAVPWVPYLWGKEVTITADTVTKYEFDQFSGLISFSHIAVNNGLSP